MKNQPITYLTDAVLITAVVSTGKADHQDFIAEAIYNAGDLGAPGNDYLYVSAFERLATYIQERAIARMDQDRS